MKTWAIAAAAFFLAAVAASAPALASSASSGASWRIVKQLKVGDSPGVTAVVAVGQNGGWAFDGPAAWQRDGARWTQVPFPARDFEQVSAAGASSATNVWAFTESGLGARALHWNGSSWSVAATFSRNVAWLGNPIGAVVVLSPSDVWAFSGSYAPHNGPGALHYDGHSWSRVAVGTNLERGSGLSPDDIWAFGGQDVAHWNGVTWSFTSVASLLPATRDGDDPVVTGIDAQSPGSVYAVGNGNALRGGGPIVILHYNGGSWTRVAQGGSYGYGSQIASDGHGGLWLPMSGASGGEPSMLHYSGGRLTVTALPAPASIFRVDTVSLIPGTTSMLGGGYYFSDATNPVGAILQYGPLSKRAATTEVPCVSACGGPTEAGVCSCESAGSGLVLP